MIKEETVLSIYDSKLTLLEYLTAIEKGLKDSVISSFNVEQLDDAHFKFIINFADDSKFESSILNLNYAPLKNYAGFNLYAQSGNNQYTVPYDINATSESILQRDNKGRGVVSSMLIDGKELNGATVEKLNANTLNYVPLKTASGYYIYAQSGSSQFTIPYDTQATGGSVAVRENNGCIKVNEPNDAKDATTKNYVDNNIVALRNALIPTAPSSLSEGTTGRQATSEEALFMNSLSNAIAVKLNNSRNVILSYSNANSSIFVNFAYFLFELDSEVKITTLEDYKITYITTTNEIKVERISA